MAKKEVSPPYKILSDVAMSGTNVITSSVTAVLYRDSLAYQFQWTGGPTGAFEIQASNDFNPGLPQSFGSLNNGNWVSLPFQNTAGSIVTSVSVSSGSAMPVLVNLSDIGFSYTRAVYTNSTSSGVLSAYISGKSYG